MNQTKRLFWLCAGVTLVSAFTSAGFSIVALLTPTTEHVNAMYGVSRSISLALAVVLVIGLRSPRGLMTLSLIMTLVQAGDALIGGLTHDVLKTLGPAFLSVLTGIVLILLWSRRILYEKENGKILSGM